VLEVQVETHADGVGCDQVVDLARLVHRDLGIASARRERAHDDRRTADSPGQELGELVDARHAERDHGSSGRQLADGQGARERQA
jgi:hypothetical protein